MKRGFAQQLRWWRAGAVMALAFVGTSASAFGWESVLEWLTSMQSEMSAWNINTKQTAVAANQESQASATSQMQLANAMGAIEMSDRVTRAVLAVDGNLGQPVTIKCVAAKNSAIFVNALSQSAADRGTLMSSFAATRVASRVQADKERLGRHRANYCTVTEARSGMCQLSANGMQGWDVNYGGPFGERTLSAEAELAGLAYVAMVADTRADKAVDCQSAACAAAASEQLALAASSAMVANSLVAQVMERRVVPQLAGASPVPKPQAPTQPVPVPGG